MKIFLEHAKLSESVVQPVRLGQELSITLTVSRERPGVSGADGVTLRCLSDKYAISKSLEQVEIPAGKAEHTLQVRVTLTGLNEAAVVDLEASAGKTVPFSVQVATAGR